MNQRRMDPVLCLLLSLSLGAAAAAAQPAFQVKDIALAPRSSDWPYQTEFVALGGIVYFTTSDDLHGTELWRSDGTEAGTQQVRDICPGFCGSGPAELTLVGGTIYFRADGGQGPALWKSDGTDLGTVPVRAVAAVGLAEINGTLVFAADSPGQGMELWKSDGTEVGTVLLGDLWAGAASSSPRLLGRAGSLLFFSAEDARGRELWKTDGTPAGTAFVEDLEAGPGSSLSDGPGPHRPSVAVGNRLFFRAGGAQRGLWASDGTPAGTDRVKDVFPGTQSGFYVFFAALNGEVYFGGSDGASGYELWKSDGTEAGTLRVADLEPGSGSSSPAELTVVGDRIFFRACTSALGCELWKTDGSEAGTAPVEDINPGDAGSLEGPDGFNAFLVLGDQLLFFAYDAAGREPWQSDGTAAGTDRIADIAPGLTSSFGSFSFPLTRLDSGVLLAGQWLFRAWTAEGWALWKSDGTPGGTALVKRMDRSGSSGVFQSNLVDLSGTLLFAARESPFAASALWRSDGSAAGTSPVPISPFPAESPTELTPFAGYVFFRAGAARLWRSDGTGEGTQSLWSDTILDLTAAGPRLFVRRQVGFTDDLAVTDGEAQLVSVRGTTIPFLWQAERPTAAGSRVFFAAHDDGGSELWISDGGPSGTYRVRDIRPGAASADIREITAHGGRVFFSADDGVAGRELWVSDGTEAGTFRVRDIRPGPSPSNPHTFVAARGLVFFIAEDGVSGTELWRSDGTEAGTVRVEIRPGAESAWISQLAAFGSRVYFSADDGVHGQELWTSDGTAGGTRMIRDLVAGPGSSGPHGIVPFGLGLLFAATDGVHGVELWQSDGTEAGTVMVQDVVPGPGSSSPRAFTLSDRFVFFVASDVSAGFELWALPRPALDADLDFYTLPPCRLADTRGGSPLSVGTTRTIAAAGLCGIPPAAKAVAVNLTVVGPTTPGHLTIFPAGTPVPPTSSINFSVGTVRANNAVLPLWDGALEALAALGSGGQVDLIVDVSGYFQ